MHTQLQPNVKSIAPEKLFLKDISSSLEILIVVICM